jgi:uncharacterized protein (TIGR02246 family)
MRWGWLLVVLAVTAGPLCPGADDQKPAEADGGPAAAPKTAGDEAGLREAIRSFVAAFDSGDAKSVAALYTPEAHTVDVDGHACEGRESIDRAYADLFRSHPGATINLSIDAVRFLGPDLAVEDGTSRVTPKPKDGPPWVNRYSAIHVRRDGRWLVAGEREYPGEEPSHRDRLKELGWLLGDWVDESEESVIHTTCRNSPDGAFLLRDFTIEARGKVVMTGTQRIGWDPQARQFRSWEFDSEGGHGDGLWARAGAGRWVIKARSVLPDGRVATATHQVGAESGDTIRWKTTDRTVGDASLPDVSEYVLVRPPPEQKKEKEAEAVPPPPERNKEVGSAPRRSQP